jgi:cellulose synthase/poly-beta-1,6-N-acetylglucosamine synthase-like glycosyltransferase
VDTVLLCTPIFHFVTERAPAGSEIVSGQIPSSGAVRGERSRLPVCVVIPAHNRAHQLPRCLASVWAQHPRGPEEVIVVDDHSTDDTAAVAASLGARVIRHSENRGASAARNTAIAASNCAWLAFLDSDDEWLPHHLSHLWEIKGDHALVGGSFLWTREPGAHGVPFT